MTWCSRAGSGAKEPTIGVRRAAGIIDAPALRWREQFADAVAQCRRAVSRRAKAAFDRARARGGYRRCWHVTRVKAVGAPLFR
jgi:hypothetical protein